MLRATSLQKRWRNGDVAFSDVTFSANRGDILAIVGPSGSGKTTLARAIAKLETTDGGVLENSLGRVGLVFQQPSLWPHCTLLENVARVLRVIARMSSTESSARATRALAEWGLKQRLHAYPAELSGGEQQRGALARTLVMEPAVLCLDEVTSALDPEAREEIIGRLIALRSSSNPPLIIIITHDMAIVRSVASHVLFMDNGRMVAQGPTRDMFSDSASPRIRRFLSAAVSEVILGSA